MDLLGEDEFGDSVCGAEVSNSSESLVMASSGKGFDAEAAVSYPCQSGAFDATFADSKLALFKSKLEAGNVGFILGSGWLDPGAF